MNAQLLIANWRKRADALDERASERRADGKPATARKIEANASYLRSCADELEAALAAPKAGDGELPEHQNIEDMLATMLLGTASCPLCGNIGLHKHTPAEIIIYRNGMKYGRRIAAPSKEAGPIVAYIVHSADAVSRMELTTEGLHGLGYGRHPVYANPPGDQRQDGASRVDALRNRAEALDNIRIKLDAWGVGYRNDPGTTINLGLQRQYHDLLQVIADLAPFVGINEPESPPTEAAAAVGETKTCPCPDQQCRNKYRHGQPGYGTALAAPTGPQPAGGGVDEYVEVRDTSDGTTSQLDEVVGFGHFHLEQMDSGHWWIAFGDVDKGGVMVNLTARGTIKASVEHLKGDSHAG